MTRTFLPLLVLVLTATAARAASSPYTPLLEGLLGLVFCCVFPLAGAVTLIVWVRWDRKERLKRTDPRWSLNELPPFPTSGSKRTAPPPGT